MKSIKTFLVSEKKVEKLFYFLCWSQFLDCFFTFDFRLNLKFIFRIAQINLKWESYWKFLKWQNFTSTIDFYGWCKVLLGNLLEYTLKFFKCFSPLNLLNCTKELRNWVNIEENILMEFILVKKFIHNEVMQENERGKNLNYADCERDERTEFSSFSDHTYTAIFPFDSHWNIAISFLKLCELKEKYLMMISREWEKGEKLAAGFFMEKT